MSLVCEGGLLQQLTKRVIEAAAESAVPVAATRS